MDCTKEQYADGNMKLAFTRFNYEICMREAIQWLKKAKAHCKTKSIISLIDLVDEERKKAGADWLESFDNLYKAQGFMWEHYKREEAKQNQAGGEGNNEQ